MDLNDDDYVDESPFHRTDDLSPPNIVTVLKSREIGNGPVRHVKYAAECKTAISILEEKTFHLHDETRLTYLVVLSDDCSRIASAHADSSIDVYSVNNGEVIRRLDGHETTACSLRFHPHCNDTLASYSFVGEVRVWNIQDGNSKSWSVGYKTTINTVAFHPTEELLMIASGNTLYFWIWSNSTNRPLYCSSRTEREYIRYLNFDRYGRLIIGILNDYREESKSMCYTSSSTDTSKDDKQFLKAVEDLHELSTSPIEIFPPPSTSSSRELPPAASSSGKTPPSASSSGKTPPLASSSGDLPPPTSSSGESPPPTSSSGESPPLVRFIIEDEGTSSASSENSSHLVDPAESDSDEIEIYISPSVQRVFSLDLDEDGLQTPMISRSPSPLENTVVNSVVFTLDDPAPRHRIQCFNLSCKEMPEIDNDTRNVVARNCTILNKSSVDVSNDGQKLVVLINEEDLQIGVYSLNKSSLGNLLCTWNYFFDAVSVSFSPLGNLVVVGTEYPDHLFQHRARDSVAHVIKISCVNGQYSAKRVREFVTNHSDFVDLHDMKWLKSPELGLVYCTTIDAFTICNPVSSRISPENLGSPPRNILRYEDDYSSLEDADLDENVSE